jgi:hypothetical protein
VAASEKVAAGGLAHVAVAAGCYLAAALWAMRVVLPHPSVVLPYPAAVPEPWRTMYQNDQRAITWAIARNARVFASGHLDRERDGQCFPMAKSYTLGEFMLAEGGLGVVPFAVSRDPVFTANAVVVLSLWLAALAMYVLVYCWTGSAGAAFVAGLLFGFDPARINDPGHASVHANMWTPLALLFAQRTFTAGRWRDVLGLASALGLQVLESFYQLLALAILGGVYGAYLAARHWRRLPSLAPKLLVLAGAVGVTALVVLGPYLRTSETWRLLQGRPLTFVQPQDFRVGEYAYPGTVVLLLALVAVVDRLRGARRMLDHDPRLPLVVGALALVWTLLPEMRLPFGVTIPSLAILLTRAIPGLSAVRGLANLRYGVTLVATVLAGFGVLVLVERVSRRARAAIVATIVVLVLGEIFYAPAALRSPASSARLAAYEARPRGDVLGVYRGLPEGAVLDLPFSFDLRGELRDMAYYVMLAAYHERPVAACYNSFKGPLQREVETLASRLPDPGAADALYALGFRTIVVHEHLAGPGSGTSQGLRALEGRTHVEAEMGFHVRFSLTSPVPVDTSLEALAAATGPEGVADVVPPQASLDFAFRNHSSSTYRHPEPIEPTTLLVRWRSEGGDLVEASQARALLPPALGRGEETVRAIDVTVPPGAGLFEVSLAPADAPDLVLGRRWARVGPRPDEER